MANESCEQDEMDQTCAFDDSAYLAILRAEDSQGTGQRDSGCETRSRPLADII